MRKGWEYKKLGEVCTIKAGYTPKKNELSDNGAYPYYKVADMNTLGNDVYLDITSSYKIDANKLFPKGAIVFPKNGAAVSTNKKRILKYDSIVDLNTGVAIFPKSINEKFAYYWFIDTDFKKYVRGGALPTLDIKSLKDKPFPSIDKSIQLAIVSELDKINELIRLKKEQLKDFDNLAQSLFYEMFGDPMENEKGWEVKKLGEIGEVKTGNTPSRSNDNFYNEKFIEWIKTDNIRNEQMNPTTAAEYLSREGAECGRIVSKGSILVACIAGSLSSLGKCCITTKNVAFNQQINAITPYGDFCNSIYLYELIRNSYKYIQQNATTGMKHILSKSIFEKMKFPFPPFPLQRLFAQRIEQIEREKSEVQKSIQDLETLLASRMQYWFE